MDLAEVRLWGRRIGAVARRPEESFASFQYDPDFAGSGIEIAPLTMPLGRQPYAFPQLPAETFHGLPGLLADSLPDTFGNALIDAWLARQGRRPESFSPVERLCYVGTRGMGALEYEPSTGPRPTETESLEVRALAELASRILNRREELALELAPGEEEDALTQLLRVGTSAGGARAKALVAWNPATNDVRSGQIDAGQGYEYWILKFDGVSGPGDDRFGNPRGYGAIEYAYSLMAREAGIAMRECRLFEEGGRRHFMTRRFDRTAEGRKLHMLTLGAIAHYDYNRAGAQGYEQALLVIRRLDLGMDAVEEQYRRMVFNILARNQDDHVKNIAFLMDRQGRWSLSPAFDLTYAYNPAGDWTARHQMTVNGKTDGFTMADLEEVARGASMKRGRHAAIYEEVRAAVARWMDFARQAGAEEGQAGRVRKALRFDLPER
ncbi:MAG: type II toxin-antitoxin system HipA family toxin [Gemmatimonadota bacterium]|nr:type II toxin-antitoxin system HipA family toxin [Gemmatimonadota bacterium]